MFHVVPSNKQELLTRVLISFIEDDFKANHTRLFTQTSIIVESQGMKHYLNMEIANATGLAVNIDYPLVSREIYRICSLVLGDKVPTDSPFKREYLVWNIYSILQSAEFMAKDAAEYANAYWQDQQQPNLQCFRLAKQVADVFEQYLIYREEWLTNWEAGAGNGLNASLESWQQIIWQTLTAQHANHPAAIRRMAINELASAPDKLPNPLYIFAVNTLSPTQIEFFTALGQHIDVYLFFLNPCAEYWGDVIGDKALLKARLASSIATLAADEQHHPLLANLGQQGRDLFNQLQHIEYPDITNNQLFLGVDTPIAQGGASMLQLVQQDIANGIVSPISWQHGHATDSDNSIQIHNCYSPLREVQVLHDELLRLLASDPTLQPHDIIVMCPSVEEYAPFVNSVFRSMYQAQLPDRPQLVCSIADRAPLNSEPMVMMFLDMLSLPDSRFSVIKIMDYLRIPAVQKQLNLNEGELDLCRIWLQQANIKWGLDTSHKQAIIGVDEIDPHYTWQWGLTRLALGCLQSGKQADQPDYAYLVDVEGINTRILGKLMVLIDLLGSFRHQLLKTQSIEHWQVTLAGIIEQLFGPKDKDNRVLASIYDAVSDLQKQLNKAQFTADIELSLIRESLQDRFGMPDALNQFLTGQVTFSSMVPMRSVPFKVMCILGLNDGVFPRISSPNSIDLIACSDVRSGDRSRRNEDRYLFLEALLSAREYLYLSYQGQSVKDNQALEPSLVLREFFLYLDKKFIAAEPVSEFIIQRQPLQPFSPTLFDTSFAEHPTRGSFDAGWLNVIQPNNPQPDSINESSAVSTNTESVHARLYLTEKQLQDFFNNPFKACVNYRYDVFLDEYMNLDTDIEPFSLDGLTKDKLLQLAVQTVLTDESERPEDYRASLINRGDISAWMLDSDEMPQYFEAVDQLSVLTKGLCLTHQHQALEISGMTKGTPYVLNAMIPMDESGSTEILLHKVASTTLKNQQLALVVLIRHCIKVCYLQQPCLTTHHYIKWKKKGDEQLASLQTFTITEAHLDANQAEALLALFIDLVFEGMHRPSFMHVELADNLRILNKSDPARAFSDIPYINDYLDNLGEQTPQTQRSWNTNIYCKWLFPSGFSHNDIDLSALEGLYQHPDVVQIMQSIKC